MEQLAYKRQLLCSLFDVKKKETIIVSLVFTKTFHITE